jgi:hypothetical protein
MAKTYMYKLIKGKVEAKVFDSDAIPDGWEDSPAKCKPVKKKQVKRGNS